MSHVYVIAFPCGTVMVFTSARVAATVFTGRCKAWGNLPKDEVARRLRSGRTTFGDHPGGTGTVYVSREPIFKSAF